MQFLDSLSASLSQQQTGAPNPVMHWRGVGLVCHVTRVRADRLLCLPLRAERSHLGVKTRLPDRPPPRGAGHAADRWQLKATRSPGDTLAAAATGARGGLI